MTSNYYNRAKLAQIILDLIYLHLDMEHDGHTDNETLKALQATIDNLKYYYQFLPKK